MLSLYYGTVHLFTFLLKYVKFDLTTSFYNKGLYYRPRRNYRRAFRLLKRRKIDHFKYFLKKYIYTINHKRIAINYLIFVIWSGLSGAALATMIRLELAYPGSHFFKGDSVRYHKDITCL